MVELSEGVAPSDELRHRIEADIRGTLVVTTELHLVTAGTLPRSEYKSRLLDFSEAVRESEEA